MIEFVTSDGQKLLEVPEDGYIKLRLSSNETITRQVKRVNDRYVIVGDRMDSIKDFADFMVRNCDDWAYEPHPETVQGYVITDKTEIGKQVVVMAHNPKAPNPYVTWQGHAGREGYDWGHYKNDPQRAREDYAQRVSYISRSQREALER